MCHRTFNLLFAAACGLILWGSASVAHAGFLVTPLDAPSVETGALGTTGSDAASEEKAPAVPIRLTDGNPFAAYFAAQGPSNGMSSQSNTGGHGPSTSPAVAPTPVTPTAGQLAIRLARQPTRYHPRFIKTRIFRPPRS